MSLGPGEIPRVVGGRSHPEDVAPANGEFASATTSWGERSQVLCIGSLSIRVTGLDAQLEDLLVRNYGGFLADERVSTDSTPRRQVAELRVLRCDRERFLYLPRAEGKSEEARLEARFGKDGLELWSYFFALAFDRDARSSRLLLCDGGELDLVQAIENSLRFFVSTMALRQGGFLLHASGVVKDGRAVIFFGPSGAGKSTTASNAPDSERLGDDLVLVEALKGGKFRACGVPFRGSFAGQERNSAACAPLALACRLVQAAENRMEDTRKPVQAAELVSQLPFLLDDAPLRERAMQRVRNFVDAVPVKRLHLKADASYWSVVEEQLRR